MKELWIYLTASLVVLILALTCAKAEGQEQAQIRPHLVYMGLTAFVYTGDPIKILLHPQAPELQGASACVGKAQVHRFEIIRLEDLQPYAFAEPYTLGEYLSLDAIPRVGHYAARWQCQDGGRWYPQWSDVLLEGEPTNLILYAELKPPGQGTIGQ